MIEFSFLFMAGLIVASFDAIVGSGGLLMITSFSIVGIPLVPAIGTMRAISLFQEGISAILFTRRLQLNKRAVIYYGILAATMGGLGAISIYSIHERVLSFVAGCILLTLLFFIPKMHFEDRKRLQYPSIHIVPFLRKLFKGKKNLILTFDGKNIQLTIVCSALCLYGGFYGAGFGTMALFPFITIGRLGLLRSVAYARIIGFCMSLAATAIFIYQDAIIWDLFLPLCLGTLVGSWLSVHWAFKVRLSWLKYLLFTVTMIVSIHLILTGLDISPFG